MRAEAADVIGFTQGHEALARQAAAIDLEEVVGQVREIAQYLVLDDAQFAITATQQMGAVDPILVFAGRGDDVIGSGREGTKPDKPRNLQISGHKGVTHLAQERPLRANYS